MFIGVFLDRLPSNCVTRREMAAFRSLILFASSIQVLMAEDVVLLINSDGERCPGSDCIMYGKVGKNVTFQFVLAGTTEDPKRWKNPEKRPAKITFGVANSTATKKATNFLWELQIKDNKLESENSKLQHNQDEHLKTVFDKRTRTKFHNYTHFDLKLLNIQQSDFVFQYFIDINYVDDDFSLGQLTANLKEAVKPVIDDDSIFNGRGVTEYGNVSLTCRASGKPKPKVWWTRLKDARVQSDEIHEKHIGQATFAMSKVKRTQSATYRCSAQNDAGIDTKELALTVHYIIYELPKDGARITKAVAIGDILKTKCHVFGIPKPSYVWREPKRSKDLKLGSVVETVQDISFMVNDELDYGNYTCTAKNKAGTKIFTVEVIRSKGKKGGTTGATQSDSNSGSTSLNVCLHQQYNYQITMLFLNCLLVGAVYSINYS